MIEALGERVSSDGSFFITISQKQGHKTDFYLEGRKIGETDKKASRFCAVCGDIFRQRAVSRLQGVPMYR